MLNPDSAKLLAVSLSEDIDDMPYRFWRGKIPAIPVAAIGSFFDEDVAQISIYGRFLRTAGVAVLKVID